MILLWHFLHCTSQPLLLQTSAANKRSEQARRTSVANKRCEQARQASAASKRGEQALRTSAANIHMWPLGMSCSHILHPRPAHPTMAPPSPAPVCRLRDVSRPAPGIRLLLVLVLASASLALDNGLGKLPGLGWNSDYCTNCSNPSGSNGFGGENFVRYKSLPSGNCIGARGYVSG